MAIIVPQFRTTFTTEEITAIQSSDTVIGLVGWGDAAGNQLPTGATLPAQGSLTLVQNPLEDGQFGLLANLGVSNYVIPDGTIPRALAAIRANAQCNVVVSMADIVDPAEADVLAAITRLLDAESEVGYKPDLIIVPEETWDLTVAAPNADANDVVTRLNTVASQLDGVAIVNAAPTSVTLARSWSDNNAGDAIYRVFPRVKPDFQTDVVDSSPYIAGALAARDATQGVGANPMTAIIKGITSLEVPVSWQLDSIVNGAGQLQGDNVNTIIRQGDWRIWGALLGVADDATDFTRFINVYRVRASVKQQLYATAFPYYGRNITRKVLDKIEAAGTAYLSVLAEDEQIFPGGKVVAPAARNTAIRLAAGDIYFILDYTPIFPAQRITTEIQLHTRNLAV